MSESVVPGVAGPQTPVSGESVSPNEISQEQAQKPQTDDKFAPKFAALTRKEKELRQREQNYQAEMKRIEAEKAELSKWRSEQKTAEQRLMEKFKANPLKFAEEQGLSFEDLMAMQLNEQNPTPEMLIKRTREELEGAYKKDLEELKNTLRQKEEESEKKQYESTVAGFKSEISDYINANPDSCELITINNKQDLVFDVIQEYYESTGRILSIEEAAKHTEEHLEEEAKKILGAKRFQAQKKVEEPGSNKAAPTLSNTQSSEVPKSGERKLSREESLAQAAKMLRWNE